MEEKAFVEFILDERKLDLNKIPLSKSGKRKLNEEFIEKGYFEQKEKIVSRMKEIRGLNFKEYVEAISDLNWLNKKRNKILKELDS